MAKVSFTGEQTKAIELRDKNLLVSAAAGSGKTAVLVERIIRRILDEKGFRTEIICGVPSFCAVAAKLNISLVEWQEQMHILPAAHLKDLKKDYSGTTVYMKTGKKLSNLKALIDQSQYEVYAVQNCGMENEQIFYGEEELPDQSDYYTTVITKEIRSK